MFKLSLAEKFDFDSGSVDFWDFALSLKKNIDMQMDEGNHFIYHRLGSSDGPTRRLLLFIDLLKGSRADCLGE